MRRVGQVLRRAAAYSPSVQASGVQSSFRASYHTMGSSSSAAPISARVCAKVQPATLLESLPVYHNIIVRGFKNPKAPRGLKTKQCAAKRFIKTGSGRIKHGHAGKAHLNIGKSRVRLARLNQRSYLTGTLYKKMNKLLLTGK